MTTSARRMRRSSHGGRWSWFPRTPVRVREPREARCSFGRRRSSARLAIPGKRWPPTGLRLPSTGGGSRPSGCLELDAIRRPVPSTEAPCQHRGRTAVRSRLTGSDRFRQRLNAPAEAWSAWDPPREGNRPGRHAEPGSTPRRRYPFRAAVEPRAGLHSTFSGDTVLMPAETPLPPSPDRPIPMPDPLPPPDPVPPGEPDPIPPPVI
jgi:hypothetical protein